MAVPVDSVTVCQVVERALSVCEAQLSAGGTMISPTQSTTLTPEDLLGSVDSKANETPVDIIVCSLLLGALTMLHFIRQAWYLWGGEGAFAFPFDRYVISFVFKRYLPVP
jgi:hypothetical protein